MQLRSSWHCCGPRPHAQVFDRKDWEQLLARSIVPKLAFALQVGTEAWAEVGTEAWVEVGTEAWVEVGTEGSNPPTRRGVAIGSNPPTRHGVAISVFATSTSKHDPAALLVFCRQALVINALGQATLASLGFCEPKHANPPLLPCLATGAGH